MPKCVRTCIRQIRFACITETSTLCEVYTSVCIPVIIRIHMYVSMYILVV